MCIRDRVISADREDFTLEDTEYFIEDIIGMAVFDVDTNQNYGKIFNVLQTGANDVYEIKDENGVERLVPEMCIRDSGEAHR